MGVFGTYSNDEIIYRVGTEEEPGTTGKYWQQLPGRLQFIYVGIDNVWGGNAEHNIVTMQNKHRYGQIISN